MFLVALTVTGKQDILVAEITQAQLDSPQIQDRLLRRAKASSVLAVVIEASDLSPDAQTVERWHALMQRIADAAPTAVALSGEVNHDVIAMFSPASRIFARETGVIEPGILRDFGAAGGIEAVRDPDAASLLLAKASGGDAPRVARLALYRDWMRRAISRRSAGADARLDAGIAAMAGGQAISTRSAVGMGLIDEIGFAPDAIDWVLEHVDAPRSAVRFSSFTPPG